MEVSFYAYLLVSIQVTSFELEAQSVEIQKIQNDVFKIPGMKRCFLKLIDLMNDFRVSPISFSIAS